MQLQQWWEQAVSGQRQVVFIAGEPGIGKTTLADRFLARITDEHEHGHEFWIGRGQCVEQYGEGEAYLPILEALGRLCRGPEGQQVQEVLHRYAPTWLLQMPGVVETTAMSALQARTAGATRERMLREIAETLEALTSERGLVVVCEDLHVSDRSTLDLIAYVARRRGPARLMVLGTYRPAEVVVRTHPLKGIVQGLQSHQQCQYLPIELLSEHAVGEYLTIRFAPQLAPPAFITQVYERTEGNALFLVTLVEYLLQQGMLRQADGQWQWPGSRQGIGIPESVRQLIERQVEQLSANERRALEVASVAGIEFSAAAVSAGLEMEVLHSEERCEGIARRAPFLQATGIEEWPDGTGATRYRFRHALYQEVVYDRLTASRQRAWHQRLGERLEAAYGQQAGEIAAALAVHFERGRDYQRAVQYLRQAGENALRRHAYHEAITHLSKGVGLLLTLPETPERTQQELALQIALGTSLMATKGYAAPEVERAYLRARELCEQVGETSQLFQVLRGLVIFYTVRADFQTARKLGERFLILAQRAHDSALIELAHMLLGVVLLWLGELTSAQAHFARGAAFHDPQQDLQRRRTSAVLYGQDPGITLLCHAAWALWLRGYPDQALQRSQEAFHLAQALSHPFSLAFALIYAAGVHQFRREEQAAQQGVEAAIVLLNEQGFRFLFARGMSVRGWALAEQGQVEEGIAQMRQSLAIYQTLGTERGQPHFLAVLAEACRKAGRREEGLTLVAGVQEALTLSGERWWEAELYRLKGELTLQQSRQVKASQNKSRQVRGPRFGVPDTQPLALSTQEAEAEACFLKAVEIARQQQAKSLELRATVSLARLWRQQGKEEEARQMLVEIYSWFTEGFDTKDLQEAKILLEALSNSL